MRHQFTKAEQISGGAIVGRKTATLKLGIHGLSPEQRRENSIRGGRIQGVIQGRKNVLSGQMEQMRIASEPQRLVWARSSKNRNRLRELGLIQGPKVDFDKIKTPESLRLGQANGGDKSRHFRWHVNRNIFNFKCGYCLAAIERKENWGIPVTVFNE
jgi:hypothetical protein